MLRDTTRRAALPIAGGFGPSDLFLACAVFLAGLAVATALHWPALMHYGMFKEDILQSPHWAAYHTTSFRTDDLVVRYASFNESPLQNAIYWVATWFVEFVRATKLLGIVSYGALSAIFFVIGRAMYGRRFGLLLGLFITVFPDQWDYSAGFFSKYWAIPLLLTTVFVLQTGRWKWLTVILPFGAIAYPTIAVLIGMTASVYWIQELLSQRGRAALLFRYLAMGSAVAVGFLALKYAVPPEVLGPMRPGAELRSMPELRSGGYPSHYIPIPSLDEELLDHIGRPFVLFSAGFYFLVLGRRGVPWERSWTALILASAIGYVLADLLFMRLYVPNRYTRYSLAVLIALWNARNWDLILAHVSRRPLRYALVAALLAVGVYSYADSYREGRGWTDRRAMSLPSLYIREKLPEGILVAGSPRRLDDVMIQGKRSVLCPYKLAHPWFTDYYDEIRERTRATLRAHFAADPEPLNELHRRYGATHFLVEKELFNRAKKGRRLFANPYSDEIYGELGRRREFYLSPAPRGLAIWENERYTLIELPIAVDDHER